MRDTVGGMADDMKDLEQLTINVVRGLAMDAPQKANSGHSGTAMALAPLAYVLFNKVMHHDPEDPAWPDRDRFVLSAGHASILLYSFLYLSGYGLTLDDLKAFRQWGSLTPGHPEVHHTRGVEVTTGPLGQGVANGVGMGIAERYLRSKFGADLCDHHTFVIAGDGCMEEGISHEAASFAGHLGLGRLVYIYDDNHITIDGPTELAYDDNRVGRFEAYGWHVEDVGESANDTVMLEAAIRRAMAEDSKPSIIILRSHIGWPSPHRTDTKEAHGEVFGDEEIRATKEILGIPPDETFWVPAEVIDHCRSLVAPNKAIRRAWTERFDKWRASDPIAHAAWDTCHSRVTLDSLGVQIPRFEPGEKIATRQALKKCLNAVADKHPGILSGGADLTGNTGTQLDSDSLQSRDNPSGRQIAFGIREHAMGSTMNGMALHGGVLPIGGTFFVFSDYMRPAVRLAAISRAHVIYSWTHDSVGLGEDGPTHQPIEQLSSLRAMPGLRIIRPADANECAQAVRIAIEDEGPTALILSRQAVPVLAETQELCVEGVGRGAYILAGGRDASQQPDLVIIGTGSEVSVCLSAGETLRSQGLAVSVVSMPSWDLFEAQDQKYKNSVLPPSTPTLSVEAGSSHGWSRYAQETVAIDHFGASAPGSVNMEKFGFTPENIVDRARQLLTRVGT